MSFDFLNVFFNKWRIYNLLEFICLLVRKGLDILYSKGQNRRLKRLLIKKNDISNSQGSLSPAMYEIF